MNRFKKLGLGLSTLAVASTMTVVGLTTQSANAVATDTCDKSLITITKTDSTNGALLANATYVVQTSGDVYVKAGDATGEEAAFKTAFNNSMDNTTAAPEFWASDEGVAIDGAYQETLGTTKASYPTDITGITNPAVQASALSNWQADSDGKIAAFEADVQTRLDALNLALTENPTLASVDSGFHAEVVAERDKLQDVADAIDTAKTTGTWATFTAAYDTMVDPANWSYGLSTSPSVEYRDSITGQSFSDANAAAATSIGASQSVVITTDANGNAEFTLFGVKDAYYDDATRGDLTCDQLEATVNESQAPSGYVLDTADYTATSLADETGALSLTNDPENLDDPTVPIRTNTGL